MPRSLPSVRLWPVVKGIGSSARLPTIAAVGLAGFVALSLVSRANVWFGMSLTRGQWFSGWGLIAALSYGPLRLLVRPAWRSVVNCPRALLAFGFIAGVWWNVALRAGAGTNLWLLPKALGIPASVVQSLADVVVATLAVAGLTALLRAAARAAGAVTDGGPEGRAISPAWPWRSAVKPTLIAVFALNLLVGTHLSRSRFIPYWDYGNYWTIADELARLAADRPDDLIPYVSDSVAHSDYNVLPALIPAVTGGLFGDSWAVFLHTLASAYGGAVALALFAAVRRLAGSPSSSWSALWPATLVVTTPLLWMPTMRGYPDLGAIAFALLALGIYLRAPARALPVRTAVALGFVLAATVLYRRWMSIWVVAFVAVAVAESMGLMALASWRRRRPLASAFVESRVLILAGAVVAAIVVAAATPLLLRILTTDYAASYVAYRVEATFAVRTANFFSAIGWAYPLVFAVAALVGFADIRLRRLTAYAVAVTVVAHIQFHRIQDLSLHHRMLYAPSYLLLLGAVGVRLIDAARGYGRPLVLAGLAAVSAFGLLLTTEPALDGLRTSLLPLAPGETVHPLAHPNPDGLIAFAERANREALDRGTTFTVIASSCEVNQTHFFNVHRALGRPRPGPWRQEWYNEVDKVGGFPESLFTCGVIVVAEPVQLHLNPREQTNVSAGTEALLNGTTVGAAFRRLPGDLDLAPGVRAGLYVRSRPFTDGEAEAFRDLLRAAHPDWPRATEPPRPIPAWPVGMTARE